MKYFLLILTAALVTTQQGITKQYNVKAKATDVFYYTSAVSFAAMLFFTAMSGLKLDFTPETLPYSIGFAAANMSAIVGMTIALKAGQLALTSLILSYSLILPTMYGLIFLHDKATVFTYLGIVLLIVSLYFLNGKKEEKKKLSVKWIIWVSIAFVGNGMCSVIQKMQQSAFDGAYKSEFMIIALLIVCVSSAVIALLGKKEHKKLIIKECFKYAPFKGLANGGVNFLVMVLTSQLPNSVLFPSISAGGIIFTYVISKILYNENYSLKQNIGFVLGILSAVILNI